MSNTAPPPPHAHIPTPTHRTPTHPHFHFVSSCLCCAVYCAPEWLESWGGGEGVKYARCHGCVCELYCWPISIRSERRVREVLSALWWSSWTFYLTFPEVKDAHCMQLNYRRTGYISTLAFALSSLRWDSVDFPLQIKTVLSNNVFCIFMGRPEDWSGTFSLAFEDQSIWYFRAWVLFMSGKHG